MGFSTFESEAEANARFAVDCARRVHEASEIWQRFAHSRGRGFGGDPVSILPKLVGRREAVDLAIVALGNPRDGYRTRASAQVAVPLEGRVRVGLPGALASIVGEILPRKFFHERGAPELDENLVVSARPSELAQRVVDERVVATLRRLARQRLDDFTYEAGSVAVVWAGVEQDVETLDGVLDLLVYVARRAQDASAYR